MVTSGIKKEVLRRDQVFRHIGKGERINPSIWTILEKPVIRSVDHTKLNRVQDQEYRAEDCRNRQQASPGLFPAQEDENAKWQNIEAVLVTNLTQKNQGKYQRDQSPFIWTLQIGQGKKNNQGNHHQVENFKVPTCGKD